MNPDQFKEISNATEPDIYLSILVYFYLYIFVIIFYSFNVNIFRI